MGIMPSKYTDEIENSSYTWRVFYMSRKSKYSAEQKLAILNGIKKRPDCRKILPSNRINCFSI